MEIFILENWSLFIVLIVVLSIWDIFWRFLAMWKAARRSQKGWFICLGIFSTAGILPIIYLLLYKDKSDQ
tara:strand:+ start:50528 stop:50737 length:210 start_codon:yes stop_codon:yes gene_type:complete